VLSFLQTNSIEMGFFSDLFSSSDPETAIKECSEALGKVWRSVENQLSDQESETVFPQFIRHPFVLGTICGFVQPIAHHNGVEFGTEDFNGVLATTLRSLVGLEVSMELGDEINRLWINPSEGDPQFEEGLGQGLHAGKMYVEGLQTPGKVATAEGVVDKGPQKPIYAESLSESYWRVLEDELL
jgi:hypothetical protein